jgi:hypothetical protein
VPDEAGARNGSAKASANPLSRFHEPRDSGSRQAHAKITMLDCVSSLFIGGGWPYMPDHSHAHVPLALVGSL